MENFEQIKKENQQLKQELMNITRLVDRLVSTLELCRQQMLPMDVSKVINKVLEDIENY